MITVLGQVLATLCCSLFAGAALYISLVEHPARMSCGVQLAATEFPPSYRRATVMQASLAVFGFVFAALAWAGGASGWWLAGGITLLAVAPFTLAVMMSTNRQLMDPALDRTSEHAARLLTRWARLHVVRLGLSLIALPLFLFLLAGAAFLRSL
ncbi:MAG TPA: DUF1772 domain-containing protein [Vicinamibacterales bacterium]|nr:DUF1772 domain-containing protein [Vicinamibacterales bacterium]